MSTGKCDDSRPLPRWFACVPFVSLLLLTGVAVSPVRTAHAGPSPAEVGPRLDPVPGFSGSGPEGTEEARRPVLRYEKPLRILLIAHRRNSAAAYMRIARRLRAEMTLCIYSPFVHGAARRGERLDMHIPDSRRAKTPGLRAYNKKTVRRYLDGGPDGEPYDVIFIADGSVLAEKEMQQKLLELVREGAVLVMTGRRAWPKEGEFLADHWPARPSKRRGRTKRSWMGGGSTPTGVPETAGLPLRLLKAHTWQPIAEATEGAVALSTGQAGSAFKRQSGKGTLLFVPTGPISRVHNALGRIGRRYDHDEIWLRFWDQTLHELVRGADALPAFVRTETGEKKATTGEKHVLSADVVNRAQEGELTLATHVTTPRGEVVFTDRQTVSVRPENEKKVEVAVPVERDWPAGLYPVYLTLADPAPEKRLHQALAYVRVPGSLSMTLTRTKRGYAVGEEAEFTLTASSPEPWAGVIRFGVFDYRGRLLGSEARKVELTPGEQKLTFTHTLRDHGVNVYAYYARAAATEGGRTWARADAKVYRYEPWDMRNDYLWSVWTDVGRTPVSAVRRYMRLYAHAGLNSLGFGADNYVAERWGWRYYDEGLGMPTFAPKIEYTSREEIEAAYRKYFQRKKDSPNLLSAGFVLGSVGEEAGFGSGWGRTYYWKEPTAPEKACRAFQWFLRTKYGDLENLNAAWQTRYEDWTGIKLVKTGKPPAPLAAGGYQNPENFPDEEPQPRAGRMKGDTREFYKWYYAQIIQVVERIFREVNPVTRTFASAPTSDIFTPAELDVPSMDASLWHHAQADAVKRSPVPPCTFAYLRPTPQYLSNGLWQALFVGNGHTSCWVDVINHFNNDLTPTYGTYRLRRFLQRFRPHARILLDRREAHSDVGVLGGGGGWCRKSIEVALQQAGFGWERSHPDRLEQKKLILAPPGYSPTGADVPARLKRYVESGGTLVFFPGFLQERNPGLPAGKLTAQDLLKEWELGLQPHEVGGRARAGFDLSDVDPGMDGLVIESRRNRFRARRGYTRHEVEHEGWKVLSSYEDGIPGLLTRDVGGGRLYFVNAAYASHDYIQWRTSTGPERRGFYRLIEWFCHRTGVARHYRLDGDTERTLHLAINHFTDPAGSIHYVMAGTGTGEPRLRAGLEWLGEETAAYDVFGPETHDPFLLDDTGVELDPATGTTRLLAFTRKPVAEISLTTDPAEIRAGGACTLRVRIVDDAGEPVPGRFPLNLHVAGPDGGRLPAHDRSFSLESGGSVTLRTAPGDPDGQWTLTVTSAVTGHTARAKLGVKASSAAYSAPDFPARGWPSEQWESKRLSAGGFLDHLRKLRALYRNTEYEHDWLPKMRLGYYFMYFPGSRHALCTELSAVDWRDYVEPLRRAVREGETIMLVGEDLGIDPASGTATYPYRDPHQIEALTQSLRGARWRVAVPDGQTLVARLGEGRVILCRESIDLAGGEVATSGGARRWQRDWFEQLCDSGALSADPSGQPIEAPTAKALFRWLTGEGPLSAGPWEAHWFRAHKRSVTREFKRGNRHELSLLIPPHGSVREAGFDITFEGEKDARLRLDVGCDGEAEARVAPGETTRIDCTRAAAEYLAWREQHFAAPRRTGNGWRIVPVELRLVGEKKNASFTATGVRVVSSR